MRNNTVELVLDFEGRHASAKKEFILGEPDGPCLFRIRSLPKYAYGLHYDDLVHTDVGTRHGIYCNITKLAKRGGHKTMRVMFHSFVEADVRFAVLQKLSKMVPRVAPLDHDTFAVDLPPNEKSSEEAHDFVAQLYDKRLVRWEFCDEYVKGSFGNMIVVKDIYETPYISGLIDRVNLRMDCIYDGYYREKCE